MSATSPAVWSQAVTLTASVTAVAPGGGTPTGTVTFYDGTTSIGTGTLNNGVATLVVTNLALGGHSLSAAYTSPANGNYIASAKSTATSLTVNQDRTTATVTSSSNPSLLAYAVTFTAKVAAAAPGTAVPTGQVTFYDGTTALGTVALDATGQAKLASSALALGTHTITAKYLGDSHFITVTSAGISQVVQKQTVASLSAAASPSNPVVMTPFSITVNALDANNNLVLADSDVVSISLVSFPPGGMLTGALSARFSRGVATFSGLQFTQVGTYVIKITSNGISTMLTISSGRQT
jgi:hypothetical protein